MLINSLSPTNDVDRNLVQFVDARKFVELDQMIEDENLNKAETYRFIPNAFRDDYVQDTGTAITIVLPLVSLFSKTGERTQKRESVLERFKAFFNRFWDIAGSNLL